jgi:endogenous inhibitor of DNA gyrase (YacG/DUF329 family)
MSEDTPPDAAKASGPPCPICGKPAIAEYKPFCSRRCADIDLGRWLKGGYAIPVKDEEDEEAGRTAESEGSSSA